MNYMLVIRKIKFTELLNILISYTYCVFLVINIISIWTRTGYLGEHTSITRMILPLLSIVLVLCNGRKPARLTISGKFIKYVLFFTVCVYLSVIDNLSSLTAATLHIYIPLIFTLLLLCSLDDKEQELLCLRFCNVVFTIALVSLLFFLMGTIFHAIGSTGVVTFEWDRLRNARSYYNLYYETQISDSLLLGVTKNSGIFTEGTMYGFVLCVSYMLERKSFRNRIVVNFILAITLLTTLSTMSIIAWAFFECVNFISKKMQNRHFEIIKIVVLPVVIFIMIYLLGNLIVAKMLTSSYSIRMDHVLGCIKAFLKTFPFGCGYDGRDILYTYFSSKQGLSVGIPYIMALGGIGGMFISVIPFILYLRNGILEKKWVNIAFALSFFWMLFCTNTILNSSLQWFVLILMLRESESIDRPSK